MNTQKYEFWKLASGVDPDRKLFGGLSLERAWKAWEDQENLQSTNCSPIRFAAVPEGWEDLGPEGVSRIDGFTLGVCKFASELAQAQLEKERSKYEAARVQFEASEARELAMWQQYFAKRAELEEKVYSVGHPLLIPMI